MGLIQLRKCKPVVLVSKRSFFFANLVVVKVFRIVTQCPLGIWGIMYHIFYISYQLRVCPIPVFADSNVN